MGILGHKDESEYLFCFDNLETQTQKIEYSHNQCNMDQCPFFALKDKEFCKEHQEEFDKIMEGKQPSWFFYSYYN